MGRERARPAALSIALEKDRELALLFRDLATLRTNIPVFESVDQLEWHGPTPAFRRFKARLRFGAGVTVSEPWMKNFRR